MLSPLCRLRYHIPRAVLRKRLVCLDQEVFVRRVLFCTRLPGSF